MAPETIKEWAEALRGRDHKAAIRERIATGRQSSHAQSGPGRGAARCRGYGLVFDATRTWGICL